LRVTRRHPLSKKERKRLAERAKSLYPGIPLAFDEAELAVVDGITIYIIDGVPCLYEEGEELMPTLRCLLKHGASWLPRLVVDRGAAKAVARGADLMAPGVKRVEGEFGAGDVVAIVDEQTGAAVAVARALEDAAVIREKVESRGRGKVAENIHHVGDDVWEACTLLG